MNDYEPIINKIPLLRRSKENNTHSNILDDRISEITVWSLNPNKKKKAILLYFLSCGILYIISLLNPKIYLSLNCDPCDIKEADYCLIKCSEDNKFTLVRLKRIQFHDPFKKSELLNSHYVGNDILNKNINCTFEYKSNRYIYLEKENHFTAIRFDLSNFKNRDIWKYLSKGPILKEFNYLEKKFRKLDTYSPFIKFAKIFIYKMNNPIYLLHSASIIIWFVDEYNKLPIIVIVLIMILNFMNSNLYFTMSKRLYFTLDQKYKIIRNFNLNNFQKTYTESKIKLRDTPVPGDIIELGYGDRIACDAILLNGFCNVDESDLNGVCNLVMKTPLPNNQNKFSYNDSMKNILFNGSIIAKNNSENKEEIKIKALVIATDENTLRGNLIQITKFKRDSYINLKIQLWYLIIIQTLVFFIVMSLEIYLRNLSKTKKDCIIDCKGAGNKPPSDWNDKELSLSICEDFTIICSPILTITFLFIQFYFNNNLKSKDIFCLSDERLNLAGLINTIILDKTGTLTDEGLELFGYQIAQNRGAIETVILLDTIENNPKISNLIHLEFWKRYYLNPNDPFFFQYKYNLDNNYIYFVECLATCHSIELNKFDTMGNTIDIKLYEKFNWTIKKEETIDDTAYYSMSPMNAHKITETFRIKKNEQEDFIDRKYKLTVVKRFEFSSKFQTSSVIVKNNLDNSYRFFIKGSSEKISKMCCLNSLPENFSESVSLHTKSGYYLIACATKPIFDYDNKKEYKREFYEKELNFLGLIIFKNNLKKDSFKAITTIKENNCNLIMATGDNPNTSISVALEASFVDIRDEIFFCNLESNEMNTMKYLKWYEIDLRLYSNSSSPSQEKINLNKINKSMFHTSKFFTKLKRKESGKDNMIENESSPNNEKKENKKEIKKLAKLSTIKTANFNDELKRYIENLKNNPNSVICLTGKSFKYIINKNKELLENIRNNISEDFELSKIYHDLVLIIREKCKIFTRMKPNDKVALIKFLKENESSIIAMCGDGANDSGALMYADLGILISHKQGDKLAPHFFTKQTSITCLETIIKNGKASYENTVIICKFIIMYSIIFNCSKIILMFYNISQFTTNQCFYIDFFILLISSITASKTESRNILSKEKRNSSLINKKFIISILGQMIIQVSIQVIFAYFMINYRLNVCFDIQAYDIVEIKDYNIYPNLFSSYIFIFSCFQYIGILFSFNFNSKHRKTFYSNKSYILYISIILFYTVCQITPNELNRIRVYPNSLSILNIPEEIFGNNLINLVILIFSILVNFFLSLFYELLVKNYFD